MRPVPVGGRFLGVGLAVAAVLACGLVSGGRGAPLQQIPAGTPKGKDAAKKPAAPAATTPTPKKDAAQKKEAPKAADTKKDQPKDEPKADPLAAAGALNSPLAQVCKNCHAGGNAATESPRLVRHDEFDIWAGKDKHSKAYEHLKDDRSRRMGELLGVDVLKERSCLSCHATASEPKAEQDNQLNAEGITCIACHSPVGTKKDWIVAHFLQPPAWMKIAGSDKEERYGLADLRDPVKRASLCLSCHLGDAGAGRVITHEMYAAGHPPLPSIEVATFSEAMPKHWWHPDETPYLKEAPEDVQKGYHYFPGVKPQARLAAAGGVANLRRMVEFLGSQAAPASSGPDGRLADFARYDCYACHHELSYPSWRQARGYPSAPGRPMPPYWPTALVDLGTELAGQPEALPGTSGRPLDRLYAALGARPFGVAGQADQAARGAVEWANGLIQGFDGARADRAMADRLLARLARTAQERIPDYESARQLAWAAWAIATDIDPGLKKNPEVARLFDALDKALYLKLPAGDQDAIETSLADRLKAAGDYRPQSFQQQFAALAGLLPLKSE